MRQIGPYKLVRVLGAGGMGQVFEASENNTGRTVALKVIKGPQAANQPARLRFVQEAHAVRQLQHPNIVAVYDFGQARGALYIAMEYLRGQPLSGFIPGPPSLSLRRKLSIMAQCAEALAYAHAQGVIHRDVKPANLIVVDGKTVKLVDFGLAELISLPHERVHGGTPPYMSPEQFSPSDVDGRSDIWSVGVTLFELLTGVLPYRNVAAIVGAPAPTLPRDFPFAADLDAVLARALAKDREMRYATAEHLAADLGAIRQKCERASLTARSQAVAARDTPSSDETIAQDPLILLAGEAAVSPPPMRSPQPSPPRWAAPAPSLGNYALPELGFQRPAQGALETSVRRFEWNERAATVRAWRNAVSGSKVPLLSLVIVAAGALWIGVLAGLPRLSPDALRELNILGLLIVGPASILLLWLIWLALTVCLRACPACGVAEHLPFCKNCRMRMQRTRNWTRVCSSREEVFFGYRDCMAALKRRLWQDAANLLSIYGEEHFSKYRERVISPSIRYHIAFFECAACGHHAARLTADQMIESLWEEQARYEEAYWGSAGAAPTRPGSAGFRSGLARVREAAPVLSRSLLDRTVVTVGATVLLLSLGAWTVFSRPSLPPVGRRISRVAASGTGRWLAAATREGRIVVWDTAGGAAPRHINFFSGSLSDLQFSADERVLAIASGNLGLYSLQQSAAPRLLHSNLFGYRSVRFSRDGQTLLAVTGAGLIETIDAHSGVPRFKVCCSAIFNEVGEAVFTPGEEAIVNAGRYPGVWNARTGQFVGRLPTDGESRTFHPIACDPRGGRVVMGSSSGAVWAWDLGKRRLLGGVPGRNWFNSVDTLTISETGSVIFAGDVVGIWSPGTWQARFVPSARPTSNVILGPHSAELIFGSANGEVEFWDVDRGRLVRKMRVPDQ